MRDAGQAVTKGEMLPSSSEARSLLAVQLPRVLQGARRIAMVLVGLYALSRGMAFLYALPHGARFTDLLPALSQAAVLALLVWLAMPVLLRVVYGPLLERGEVRRVVIRGEPHPFYAGFRAMSPAPWLLGKGVEAFAWTVDALVPTRLVHYSLEGGGPSGRLTGALYRDQRLPPPPARCALADPQRPTRAWLVRYPEGKGNGDRPLP